MTKDTRVLNANATKFKDPLHVSERVERSEARADTRVSQKSVPSEVWARDNAGLHRTN